MDLTTKRGMAAIDPPPPGLQMALLGQGDAALVRRFYLSLSPAERLVRFRGAATDAAIDAYCARIDWGLTMVAAGGQAPNLRAAVHIQAKSAAWDRVVLTLACAGGTDVASRRAQVLAHLVQLSVQAAGQRGCCHFAVRLDALSWSVMPLLAGMGPGEIGEQLAQRLLDGPPQPETRVAAMERGSLTPA